MTEKEYKIISDNLGEYSILRSDNTIVVTEIENKTLAELVVDELNVLNDEKEQYKQSATMYHTLFIELQKQLKGVKRASDLDSKDFEGLIELSKGNVFDDKLGWIHLPVKEELE